jgi:hypothetical protein
MYIPEDATAPIPDPPLLKQDFSRKYYYVYNYTHFVRLVNTALQEAFADLYTQVPVGDASPLFATVAPYIDFDVQTNRVIVHAEQTFYDEVYTELSSVNSVKIYFNERLYDLFCRSPVRVCIKYGRFELQVKKVLYTNSNLISKTVLVTGVPTAGTKKVNYVQMAQEISSVALWNPVASIIFASSLLPIHSTQTSLPKNAGDINNNFTEIGNNSNLLNAISDFSIAVDGNNQ